MQLAFLSSLVDQKLSLVSHSDVSRRHHTCQINYVFLVTAPLVYVFLVVGTWPWQCSESVKLSHCFFAVRTSFWLVLCQVICIQVPLLMIFLQTIPRTISANSLGNPSTLQVDGHPPLLHVYRLPRMMVLPAGYQDMVHLPLLLLTSPGGADIDARLFLSMILIRDSTRICCLLTLPITAVKLGANIPS